MNCYQEKSARGDRTSTNTGLQTGRYTRGYRNDSGQVLFIGQVKSTCPESVRQPSYFRHGN